MAMAAAWLLAAILAAATGALTTAATNARFTVNGTELQIHPIPGDGDCLFRSLYVAAGYADTDDAIHAFRRRVVARVQARVEADPDARAILLAELKTDARCHYYQKHGCVTQVYERAGCDDAALLTEYFRRMAAGPREPPPPSVPARAYYGGAPEIVAASAELGVVVMVCDPARAASGAACFALRDEAGPDGGVAADAPRVHVVRRRGAEHYDAALPVHGRPQGGGVQGRVHAADSDTPGAPPVASRELRGGGEPEPESESEPEDDATCAGEPLDGRRVLLLGGNGFMGADAVELLAAAGAEVWAANRGTAYWDYEVRARPRLHRHVHCARDAFEKCAAALPDAYFDAVVDFSGFRGDWVRASAAALVAKARSPAHAVYVYVSTDSVYEVCDTEAQGHAGVAYPSHARARAPGRRLVEGDAVRPAGARERARLNDADGYGNDKLEGEEALARLARAAAEEGGAAAAPALPYVSLRLPDVVGARDNGPRGPATMLGLLAWADHRDQDPDLAVELRPACPPSHDGVGLSAVWARDVARAALAVLRIFARAERTRDPGLLAGVAGEAFNLAFDEAPSLRGLLATWAGAMGLLGEGAADGRDPATGLWPEEALPCSRGGGGFNYPSTTRGPIDNAKAKARLGWTPSPLAVALRATARFYFDSDVAQAAALELFRREGMGSGGGGGGGKGRGSSGGAAPSEHAVESWARAVHSSAHGLGFDSDGLGGWLADKLAELRRKPGYTVPGPRSPLEGDDVPRSVQGGG